MSVLQRDNINNTAKKISVETEEFCVAKKAKVDFQHLLRSDEENHPFFLFCSLLVVFEEIDLHKLFPDVTFFFLLRH